MLKKKWYGIPVVLVSAMLALVLVTSSAVAFFSGTEETTGNVIQADITDDLVMSVDNVTPGTFTFTGISPGEDLDSMTIKLANVGQNNGYLYQRISYVEADKSEGHLPSLTADEFAALIYVKSIWYQHFGTEGYVGTPRDDIADFIGLDAQLFNGDGYMSLYEMMLFGWMPYDIEGETDTDPKHTLKAGEAGTWTIVFCMADSLVGHEWGVTPEPIGALDFDVLDNAPQADGIDITWTAILSQSPIFDDLP